MPIFRLIILSLLLFSCEAQAQFHFGVRGGVNMARMSDRNYESDYLFGFHTGLYFRGVAPVTVQVELLYSGQGGTFRDLTTGETSERRLHYLNPAFLLRYTPSESYSFLGGLHLGVLIVAREGSVNISDSYDPMDLGLHLGFEYNVSRTLGFTTRFLQSLRNIGNQVLQVGVVIAIQESE
jgi:hypothetical protein